MRKLFLTTLLLLFLLPGSASALDVRPLTWDVIGLESAEPKIATGPNTFPVGAEICNNTGSDIADVRSDFVWDSANSYIQVEGPAEDLLGELAFGECQDTFFVVRVQKTADAWNTARAYHIEVSGGGESGSTPLGRQLYVERLVGQNRNATLAVSGPGGCNATYTVCDPPPSRLQVGEEYTYKLYGETSAPHDQITSFLTFPGNIFQIERVRSTYEFPSGAETEGPYADACGWQADPSLPNYLSCTGPPPAEFLPDGKAGGRVVTTYKVLVIGEGEGTLRSLINDHSGSSYHYNNDYGDIEIDFQSQYPLSVLVFGTGSVLSDPQGIDCGAACQASYDSGREVLLTATPGPGQDFLGWGGACSGTEVTCTVTMSEAQNVTASFTGRSFYPLQVEVTEGGRVSSDVGGIDCPATLCNQTYEEGTGVQLVPEALPGYRFVGWEGDCAGEENSCDLLMSEARFARAVFEAEEPLYHTLLFRENANGQASSTSAPDQAGQIDCGISCLATYPEGAQVTIQAQPQAGWELVAWGDDCAGVDPRENCVLDMNSDKIASATYREIRWPLLVSIKGQGEVSGSGILCPAACQKDYSQGTEITLQAEPRPGWKFIGWEGDCTARGVQCSATMDRSRAVVARFVLQDPRLRIRIRIRERKIYRGDFFRTKVVFRNINKDTALDARPCLRVPTGIRVIQTDGGVQKEGRICWQKKNMDPQRGRRFFLQMRGMRVGKYSLLTWGYATNAPRVDDRDGVRVWRRPRPHPPTG